MNKIPYADTSVPASQSRADIDSLLKKIGAVAIQWTETPSSIQGKECPIDPPMSRVSATFWQKSLYGGDDSSMFMSLSRMGGASGSTFPLMAFCGA